MADKTLTHTNPYLKDSSKRREGLIRSVTSSSAIEGIHNVIDTSAPTPSKSKKSTSRQKPAETGKLHR